MRRMFCSLIAASLLTAVGLPTVFGQDAEKKDEKPAAKADEKPAEEPAGPKPVLSVKHLENPSGICVHPGTGQVFITSQQGVFRLVPGEVKKIYLEVKGFPTDIYGKGPKYNIGPLGCTLWGTDRLIIADGSRPDSEELV